ncbi:MAG: Fic family protein [Terracidiphilus sp.]|jgi:cell filamentation protein
MTPTARDPYVYPGTNVLINLRDIRDQARLEQFEADAVFLANASLKSRPITGAFDIARLQETHRRIFGRVYSWAGEVRKDVGLTGKNRSGFVIAYGAAQNVPGALATTFAALKTENDLQGLDAAAFAKRMAWYYSEFDAIHAFRDGNSRTLRVFASDLAQAAGHPLDWARVARTAEDTQRLYHARDLAVMRGDLSELTAIIAASLRG